MAIKEDERTFSDMELKSDPAGADLLQIADSEDGGRVKKILISALLAEDGTDANAIHVDEANEIHGLTDKPIPLLADEVVGETSLAGAWTKIRMAVGNLFKAVGWIDGLTAKAVPTAADTLVVGDAAAAGAPKKSTLQQLFAALGLIDGLTLKAAPVAADTIAINDSAAGGAAAKATIGSLAIAQAQVVGILLEPAADAAVTILGTTSAVVLQVSAAGTVVIANGAGLYAGQAVQLFARAVAGGGKYTLVVQGGTLNIDGLDEAPIVKRNAANNAWVVISKGGATIV
jgi:hypothetical protein